MLSFYKASNHRVLCVPVRVELNCVSAIIEDKTCDFPGFSTQFFFRKYSAKTIMFAFGNVIIFHMKLRGAFQKKISEICFQDELFFKCIFLNLLTLIFLSFKNSKIDVLIFFLFIERHVN